METGCKGVGVWLEPLTPLHPYTLAKTLDFSFLCVSPSSVKREIFEAIAR